MADGSKSKDSKKSASSHTFAIICAAIPTAALLIVLGLVLYPSMMARAQLGALSRRAAEIAEADSATVLVTHVTYQTLFESEESDETLYEGDEARAMAGRIADALSKAEYLRRVDAEGGNFDTRVRLGDEVGENAVFYYCENGEIYFSKGITRFYFGLDLE